MSTTPPPGATNPPTVPADVILPRSARGPLLLGSWIAGSLIAITNGAYLAVIGSDPTVVYPLWLLVATVVTGGVSAQINAIARANLNPPPAE